jgi:hypothetical protein
MYYDGYLSNTSKNDELQLEQHHPKLSWNQYSLCLHKKTK